MSEHSPAPSQSASSGRGIPIVTSPILWGAALAAGFYAAIPYLPAYADLVERYFCSHPLEYVTTGLFFVGIAILFQKLLALGPQNAALEADVVDPGLSRIDDVSERCARLEEAANEQPARLQQSWLVQRIRETCSHVRSRRSAEGIEEHLKYLAEVASERLHGSYALLRTITWAVPILGFLGTVIGITIAIANVTPEQLDSSLGEVTSGLAVAFDTTALALTLSLLLVFGSFVVERSEQRVLARVEDFALRELVAVFPPEAAPQASPLLEAERSAAERLVQQTEALVDQQTRLWQESLESMRARWSETLEQQQQQLQTALSGGVEATLADHQQQLAELRTSFVEAFENAAGQLQAGIASHREAQERARAEEAELFSALGSQIQEQLRTAHETQQQQTRELVSGLADGLESWRAQLESTSAGADEQLAELRRQGETLLRIVDHEQELGRLQERLTENLEAVRSADTFEETLHELTAAVHLLTARARPKAA